MYVCGIKPDATTH
jgi:L-cysteine:1D-myo-inositol 2-amino-2-deoxy-alpha-D-glucopyranoside ligase